jgi:hypothetical protein
MCFHEIGYVKAVVVRYDWTSLIMTGSGVIRFGSPGKIGSDNIGSDKTRCVMIRLGSSQTETHT